MAKRATTIAAAPAQSEAAAVLDDWLAVSTEGFAGMNAGRDPAHLVKELVQNSLDAVGEGGGEVHLTCEPGGAAGGVLVICRDAVASGYLLRLHRACLPALLPEMEAEEVRQDWVGCAVAGSDEDVQKEVIRRGFGEKIARSVPKMGVRQYDEDAREIGVEVVDTKQTSGGFREVLQPHVPTTKETVDRHNRQLVAAAAAGGFDPDDAFRSEEEPALKRRTLIEAAGGSRCSS